MHIVRMAAATLILAACAAPAVVDPSPQSGTVTTEDGVELAYTTRGAGATTLVFVHCWSCDQSFWKEQVDVFDDDYRVVTLDLGGHGASGSNRSEWTLEGLAGDVRAVVEHLELDNVILVGHSMGGPVSLFAAASMPGTVEAVVAVDTLHNAEFRFPPGLLDQLEASYRDDWGGTTTGFIGQMFAEGADPAIVQWVVERALRANPDVVLPLLAAFGDYDAVAAFSAAGVPIRSINASGGRSQPTEIEINRKYADYDARLIEGVGHFLQLEAPEAFNAQLREVLAEL